MIATTLLVTLLLRVSTLPEYQADSIPVLMVDSPPSIGFLKLQSVNRRQALPGLCDVSGFGICETASVFRLNQLLLRHVRQCTISPVSNRSRFRSRETSTRMRHARSCREFRKLRAAVGETQGRVENHPGYSFSIEWKTAIATDSPLTERDGVVRNARHTPVAMLAHRRVSIARPHLSNQGADTVLTPYIGRSPILQHLLRTLARPPP